MERRFYSCSEIAEYLGTCEKTVRRLCDRGEVPSVRIGRSVRIDIKKLEEILEARELGRGS